MKKGARVSWVYQGVRTYGKVTGVEITCQKPYDSIPDINIVNEGIGAILRPIMSSTPTKTNTDQTVLQSVDCVGAYPKPGEY